jgi:hypothetical protein
MKIVNEATLDLFRLPVPCAWCRIRVATDPHHLFGRGHGGGLRLDVAIALVSLCATCHRMHHDGHQPTRRELLKIVARREKVAVETLLERIHELQRLPKGSPLPAWASESTTAQPVSTIVEGTSGGCVSTQEGRP